MTSMECQETTVTQLRNSDTLIYTANPVHLRALRKNDRATEVKGGDDWGEFVIAAGSFDPLKGFKRAKIVMTDEQRAARAESFRRNVLGK